MDPPAEQSVDVSAARGFAATIAATVAFVGVARLIAPRVHPSADASALIVFLGAAVLAIGGLSIGVRARISGRLAIGAVVATSSIVGAIYLMRGTSTAHSIVVDASLMVFALAVGGAIGTHVEHPGHLLPAGFIAAAADVFSVTSPGAPTNAIASSARALSLLTVSFPVPGTIEFAPALGLGDLIFIALIFGVARVHALPYVRTVACAFVGVLVAGFASAVLEMAVPALPTIAGAVLLGVPQARRVRPKDRGVARAACLGAILFIAFQIIRMRLRG